MTIDLFYFLLYTFLFLYFWKFISVNRMSYKLNKILKTGNKNYSIILGFLYGFILAVLLLSAVLRFFDIMIKIFAF